MVSQWWRDMPDLTGGAAADDLFPPSDRVVFEHTPLLEVVVQVRFPTILRIEQTPTEFQDRIRATFPLYEKVPTAAGMPIAGGPPLPQEFMQMFGGHMRGVSFNFRTEQRDTTLTLSNDFLTMTTTFYRRWEDFIALFSRPVTALEDVYTPNFYSRVGLRHVNGIHRDMVNLPWTLLIRPEILGEITIPAFEENSIEDIKRIRVKLASPEGIIIFQHGLAKLENRNSPSYMIDLDI